MNQDENKNIELNEEQLEEAAGGVGHPVMEPRFCSCGGLMKIVNGKWTCVKCKSQNAGVFF